MLKEALSTGLGDKGVVFNDILGMFRCKVGVLKVSSLFSFCFFRSETMTVVPLGVVMLISESVSTEVEAVISGEERGEEAVLSVFVVSLAGFRVVSACADALFLDS